MIRSRFAGLFTLVCTVVLLLGACGKNDSPQPESKPAADPFTLLATSDLKDLLPLEKMAKEEAGLNIRFSFGGTMESTERVLRGEAGSDAAWFANARYLLSDPAGQAKVKLQEKIMLSPLVLGVSASDARTLGWDKDTPVNWKDITQAAKRGDLRYTMSNPGSSNQGFMAVMGVAAAFAEKPEALTLADVNKERLADFLKGYKLVGDNSTYLSERFIEQQGKELNAYINYESLLLSLNRSGKLKEPLTLIYPHEGVATADFPLMLLNDSKRETYQKLVAYLKSDKVQNWLAENTLRRPIKPEVMQQKAALFGGKHMLIELPFSTDRAVADALVNAYLNEFRTPIASTFVLDVSGSMQGHGRRDALVQALHFLSGRDDTLSGRFARLTSREKIWLLPFSSDIESATYFEIPQDSTAKAQVFQQIGQYAEQLDMNGSTRLYDAVLRGIRMMGEQKRQNPGYHYSVVTFTDGQRTAGASFDEFNRVYRNLPELERSIPLFVILFGEGNERELKTLAELSRGRVFDARKTPLVSVFKEIRAYQ